MPRCTASEGEGSARLIARRSRTPVAARPRRRLHRSPFRAVPAASSAAQIATTFSVNMACSSKHAEAGGVAEPFADDGADQAQRRGEPQRRQRSAAAPSEAAGAAGAGGWRRRSCASSATCLGSTVSRPSSVFTVTGKNVR